SMIFSSSIISPPPFRLHLYTTILAANTTSISKFFHKNYTILRVRLLAAAFGRPRLRRPLAKKQGISHPFSNSFGCPRQGIKKRHRFVLPMALPRQMAGLYSVVWSRGAGPD